MINKWVLTKIYLSDIENRHTGVVWSPKKLTQLQRQATISCGVKFFVYNGMKELAAEGFFSGDISSVIEDKYLKSSFGSELITTG